MAIKAKIIAALTGIFSREAVTVLISTLPIFELRLAIPLGIIKFHLPAGEVYFLALLGNMIPVVPLLFFLRYFLHALEKNKSMGKFFRWWFRSVERRSKIVERWGFWGLVCFVAIPLPVTGAWTGAAAATLFEIKIKKAFFAILIGVAVAGVIMTSLSLVASKTIKLF